MASKVGPPWQGKPWADAAAAANLGMNGQGYIVHAMMRASQIGGWLAIPAIALAALQAAAAVVYLLVTFKVIHP